MASNYFKIQTRFAFSVFVLFFTLSTSLQAQVKLEDDKGTDEVKKFAYYVAQKGETAFSIARKFNQSLVDFYKNNPQSNQGIHDGDELRIPVPFTVRPDEKLNKSPQRLKYIVGRKETLYAIARMFNTTQEEILKVNPSLKGVLSKGEVLNIPLFTGSAASYSKTVEQTIKEYTIVSGDNYFQLQKRFGVSQAELEQLNPALKDGFRSGLVIKLPAKKGAEVSREEVAPITKVVAPSKKSSLSAEPAVDTRDAEPTDKIKERIEIPSPEKADVTVPALNKTFKIGIYLPFCLNLNDSVRSSQHTNSFLEFYSGVLLATEKLTSSGMKVKLFVFDTYHDSDVVNKLVRKPEFLSLDLIIGPVYPKDQKIVAELSAKNFIPMVSPLSPESRFVLTTPGYYLINPGRKLRLASTADYISENFFGQNIILLNHGADSDDETFLLNRLNKKPGTQKVKQYNILSEEAGNLEEQLKGDRDNIFILAEENEANVSVAMTRLNTISKTHKIKVIGLLEYTKMQSIDIEYLHNTNLHYLAPYYIDYGNSKVNSFVEKYRSSYGSEPSQYSFQGYDIGLYFISSLGQPGKVFRRTNSNPGVDLLQAEYNFQKPSPFGGYINRTLYIIEYTNNFEIHSVGKIRGSVSSEHGGGMDFEFNGLDQ